MQWLALLAQKPLTVSQMLTEQPGHGMQDTPASSYLQQLPHPASCRRKWDLCGTMITPPW